MFTDRIILATDFSDASQSAMAVAANLAKLFKTEILVVHVFEYQSTHHKIPVGWMIAQIWKEKQEQIAEATRTLRRLGVNCEAELIHDGFPSLEIPAIVQRFAKPVVVLGTHADTGIDRKILGSTAEGLLRSVECPVVTVGPRVRVTDMAVQRPYRIVYATDFSAASLVAAPYVRALHEVLHAVVRVIHVTSDSNVNKKWRNCFARTKVALDDAENPDSSIEYGSIPGEHISDAIIQDATRYKADLVVLGVKRAVLASRLEPKVAAQVIFAATCPVLTISS